MDLPNSTLVLVLGILSLIFCWCYGFVGLILGIIAVVLSGSPRRMYRENPENYFEASYKNLNAGSYMRNHRYLYCCVDYCVCDFDIYGYSCSRVKFLAL